MRRSMKVCFLCIVAILIISMPLSAAGGDIYITNLPSRDSTLTGDNTGTTHVVEAHTVRTWAGRQQGQLFIIDAGNFAYNVPMNNAGSHLASLPVLSAAVLGNGTFGRLSDGRLVSGSDTLSIQLKGGVPVSFVILDSEKAALAYSYNSGRVTVGFTEMPATESERVLGRVNSAKASSLDILVTTSSGGSQVEIRQVQGAVLIVMPSPSPEMLKLSLTDAPFSVRVEKYTNQFMQSAR